jgi:tetratricopeptide (TPR) repeat protein
MGQEMLRKLFTFGLLLSSGAAAHADAGCSPNGAPQEVIAGCSALIAQDATNASVYFLRGTAYLRLQNYPRAAGDFSETIRLGAASTEAYNNRALARLRMGDNDGAIEDATHALSLSGPNAGILANRGDALRRKGQFNEAIADYTAALTLDPKLPDPLVSRGALQSILGAQNEAIADFSRALELDPKYAEAYFNRGAARYATGDFASAATDFERASSLVANPYSALIGYLAMTRSGKDATAQLTKTAVSFSDGRWPQVLLQLYLGKQQAEIVLSAASNSSETCEANFYVGSWLLLSKKHDQAQSRLKFASETCPPHYIERMLATAELKRTDKKP